MGPSARVGQANKPELGTDRNRKAKLMSGLGERPSRLFGIQATRPEQNPHDGWGPEVIGKLGEEKAE